MTDEDSAVHVLTGPLFRHRAGSGNRFDCVPPPPSPDPARRPARVALVLAQAHRIQMAIEGGHYRDQAHAAQCLELTRARVTQLLNLTFLAPDVQEEVLHLESLNEREPISERALRFISRHPLWTEQRALWLQKKKNLRCE